MAQSTSYAAVITGDIVGSQRMEREAYEQVLAQLTATLQWLEQHCQAKTSVFQGDAFQVLLPRPGHTTLAMLLIRLGLRGLEVSRQTVDARLSIAIAASDQPVTDINTSTHEALVISGRALSKMRSELLVFGCTHPTLQAEMGYAVRFLGALIGHTSSRQAQALRALVLCPDATHDELAQQTGMERSALSKLLGRTDHRLILAFNHDFYERTKELLL